MDLKGTLSDEDEEDEESFVCQIQAEEKPCQPFLNTRDYIPHTTYTAHNWKNKHTQTCNMQPIFAAAKQWRLNRLLHQLQTMVDATDYYTR